MKAFILALLVSVSAHAATTVGESSFTAWTSAGPASIDIRETDDGKLLGRSAFDSVGNINLKNNNGTLKGFSDGGFTEVTCTATRCEGQVGSGTVSLDIKENTTGLGGIILEGSVNHVYVYAKITLDKIEIRADASLEMDLKNAFTATYTGTGVFEPLYTSQVLLKSSGTLVQRLYADPAYFVVYLIAPLVRNGI